MSQKAKNLATLFSNGIRVPQGFSLPPEHYQAAVAVAADKIFDALPDERKVRDVFTSMNLLPDTRSFIKTRLAALPGATRFAVRSSGAIAAGPNAEIVREDSADISLAGQFDSYLNVPREFVEDAVKRCWSSLFNERSIASFNIGKNYILRSAMTVVVQEMIPARASAVIMTVDPQGDGRTGAIEFTWGSCGAIVGGIASPDEAVFDRSTGRLISIRVGRKECRLCYAEYGLTAENEVRVATSLHEQQVISLESPTLLNLIEIGKRIEEIFDRPQDIEAVVAEDGRIFVTQTRPVTMLSQPYTSFTNSAATFGVGLRALVSAPSF